MTDAETAVDPDAAGTLEGNGAAEEPVATEATGGRRWRAFRRNKSAMIAAAFLVLVVLTAVLAPVVATHDPNDAELREIELDVMTDGHLLGTDSNGRDLFSRIVFGARVSLLAGLGTVLLALAIALPLGMIAGYYRGKVDTVLTGLVDALLAVPPLILVFAIAGILGPGLRNAIIALGVFFTPLFIRLIRGEVRGVRGSQLIEAQIAMGFSSAYIMRRHILPLLAAPLIVQASLSVGTAILAETSLSFLGLGAPPPTASWGNVLRQAFDRIEFRAWPVFVPGLAIASTVLAINMFGDGLRDSLGRLER